MNSINQRTTDVLIIGAGAAGLSTALHLAKTYRVLLLSKENILDSSTNRAQGGIASVTHPQDTIESHIEDTVLAGDGLCNESVVHSVISQSKTVVQDLLDLGLEFDSDEDGLHLVREGAHKFPRVLHVADSTGYAIGSTLLHHAIENPNIEINSNRLVIDVITRSHKSKSDDQVWGAYVYDRKRKLVETILAPCVVLATGGASKVYKYTSNPDSATGDGIAIGARAGCRVSNMEFNQFHPTCLYHPAARSFLISEAVRGEGGKLLRPDGTPFMQQYDRRLDLATRDVVARAIDSEMKRLGLECVYLDISHREKSVLQKRFPMIFEKLLELGIDMAVEPIPVVPAAHYTCGGILVNQQGATDVSGLYAVGETACTGLHGANRLASNSLLECLVYARAVARHVLENFQNFSSTEVQIPDWDESLVVDSDEDVVLTHNWGELRGIMWNYVGIARTDKRLERAGRRIELLKQEIVEYYANYRVNPDLLELRNLILVADLIVKCARWRKESRGLHFTLDYPQKSVRAVPSVVKLHTGIRDVFENNSMIQSET